MTSSSKPNDDDAPPATAKHGDPAEEQSKGDTAVGRAVTINRPVGEVFSYFRDFANLASFMENIVRVEVGDGRRSHWVVKAPGGKTAEWDAILTEESKDALLAWESAEGADIPNSGRVEFRDAGARGTVVIATIAYDPPAGTIGKLVAKLFQREPAIQARRDLRRFKQLMETGEIATGARTAKQHEEEMA